MADTANTATVDAITSTTSTTADNSTAPVDGNVSTNNTSTIPGKVEAKADQAIGSANESVGNAAGSNNLKGQGIQQNAEEHGKETANNVAGFFHKMTNEVQGTFKGLFNAFSGSNKKIMSCTRPCHLADRNKIKMASSFGKPKPANCDV
ncbi:uncharacterized protein ATC70_000930 [Mucor velutinosus]|uniref:Uncharacterized protein n=1 Tax=Mucor velutinosus TaxID=708070 RepID=A0AAN7DMV1_9FUNG|nr:hypothetical protein ATC70_000930 [Mucor velutinosus]